jgi:hypothetical protein
MRVSIHHGVIPLAACVLFLAFLVLLGSLGRLAAQATRGPADGKRGCLGGCGLFAVLAFLCALGIAGFLGFLLAALGATAVEHNPIRSVQLLHVPGAGGGLHALRGRDALVVRFEALGEAPPLLELLRRRFDLEGEELELSVTRGEDGTSTVEVVLPVGARDVEDLRRDLEESGWKLPSGVRVELKDYGYPL